VRSKTYVSGAGNFDHILASIRRDLPEKVTLLGTLTGAQSNALVDLCAEIGDFFTHRGRITGQSRRPQPHLTLDPEQRRLLAAYLKAKRW
jgi:hypothetical protein